MLGGGGGRLGMLFFCELYVIRDELALLGRTAHHPRSWASTSYNYTRSWASTSYNYNYQLPATSRMVLEQRFRSNDESCLADGRSDESCLADGRQHMHRTRPAEANSAATSGGSPIG